MDKIPFTSYDFWAYLSAGFLLLFVADYAVGTAYFDRDAWTIVEGTVAATAAYVCGQLVASVSSILLERGIVGRILARPSVLLFEATTVPKWQKFFFGEYSKPFPPELSARGLGRAQAAGIAGPGEAMFQAAHLYACSLPPVAARMEKFQNAYGFCRNAALVAWVDGGLLLWRYYSECGVVRDRYMAIVALIAGVGLFFRYLKFYRLYNTEVLRAYSLAP